MLIDCINSNRDGGIVEDLWAINRVNQSATQTVLFYLSTAADYLRQDQAVYVGSITIPSSTAVGAYVAVSALPKVLAPVPQVGSDPKNQAFYIPGGKALWVTVQRVATTADATLPIAGAQGGFY